MENANLEELRGKVPCSAVLEEAGFALDLKERSRKAMKYRRASKIIIVIHAGKGWLDPLPAPYAWCAVLDGKTLQYV